MADDTQFDAFAGVMTPQMLELQRAANQQQLYREAAAQAGDGRNFGARAAGITLGAGLGAAGGPQAGNNPMDRFAAQNQQILSAPDEGSLQGTPAPGGAPAGAAAPSPQDPYAAKAAYFDAKSRAFAQAGNYQVASQFASAAQIARKQGQDAAKSAAEAYKDTGQGANAFGHLWSVPQVGVNPSTGKEEYFQTGPGGAVRWNGAPARPQVAAANITLNQEKPFLDKFSKTLDTYKQSADTAIQGLGQLKDARQKLDDGVITGTGADARLQFGTLLDSLGLSKGDDKVANTNAFISETKSMALASRPSGFSRITNADLAYLQDVSGGKIALTEPSIRKIFDIRQKALEGTIAAYNKTASTLKDTAAKSDDKATKASLGLASSLYPTVDTPDSSPTPIMTPEQVRAAMADPKMKGKAFRTTDGRAGTIQ